jgi:hypothetical protein
MRVKYPLSPEGQELARQLVREWNEGGQQLTEYHTEPPYPMANILELDYFKLIRFTDRTNHIGSIKQHILLLQELRNAVASDFDVSDYFLTLNAVGTIIYGDLNMRDAASFQSAASMHGDIHQTMSALADDIETQLGQDFLKNQADLKTAIDGLRDAVKGEEKSRIGKVIEQIGFYIGLGADTVTVLPTLISLIAQLRVLIGQ